MLQVRREQAATLKLEMVRRSCRNHEPTEGHFYPIESGGEIFDLGPDI